VVERQPAAVTRGARSRRSKRLTSTDTAYVSVSPCASTPAPYITAPTTRQDLAAIAGGLPRCPVNGREDPERKGLLFAATETAVWTSAMTGALGLAAAESAHTRCAPVDHDDDLMWQPRRSIWILDDISRLRQVTSAAPMHAVYFFARRRLPRTTQTWTTRRFRGRAAGENPPAGRIDFFCRRRQAPVMTRSARQQRASGAALRSDDLPSRRGRTAANHSQYWLKPRGSWRARHARWVWDLRRDPSPPRPARFEPILRNEFAGEFFRARLGRSSLLKRRTDARCCRHFEHHRALASCGRKNR